MFGSHKSQELLYDCLEPELGWARRCKREFSQGQLANSGLASIPLFIPYSAIGHHWPLAGCQCFAPLVLNLTLGLRISAQTTPQSPQEVLHLATLWNPAWPGWSVWTLVCVCICQALSIRVRSFFGTSSRGTVYPTEVSFCGSVHISEDAHNISEDAFRRTCERTWKNCCFQTFVNPGGTNLLTRAARDRSCRYMSVCAGSLGPRHPWCFALTCWHWASRVILRTVLNWQMSWRTWLSKWNIVKRCKTSQGIHTYGMRPEHQQDS